jgi:hypothetical protein
MLFFFFFSFLTIPLSYFLFLSRTHSHTLQLPIRWLRVRFFRQIVRQRSVLRWGVDRILNFTDEEIWNLVDRNCDTILKVRFFTPFPLPSEKCCF